MVIFIVSIVLIPLKQRPNLIHIKKHAKKKEDFYDVVMPFEDTKILEFNQYQKSDETTLFMQILNL